MSSVPPTNSVQTSEPTFTTISARVIEGLSVLNRLPARGSFLAQIIEIKEPNLIKLSVGIKELKARINGNVPPSIKPNMTIKFHTTAQKNNIKLFLPEPENLVGSTKQRSNATDHNTAIKLKYFILSNSDIYIQNSKALFYVYARCSEKLPSAV